MSYPNPPRYLRRKYRMRRAKVISYEIAFGAPNDVVDRVNELLADGW